MADELPVSEGENPTTSPPPKLTLLVLMINTLSLLAALGLFFYSKFLFKRPAPSDEQERDRLKSLFARGDPGEKSKIILWPPLNVNIAPVPIEDHKPNGITIRQGSKLRYVSLVLAIELRDEKREDMLEELKPFVVDRFISLLGKKNFQDLTTVQGRYILVSEMIEIIQQVISSRAKTPPKEAIVNHIYFTDFTVN